MKMNKIALAVAITSTLMATTANATFLLPTSYDKEQDVKIDKNADAVNSLKDRDAQLAADIHTTYTMANTKYTESAGKALEGQVKDLQNNKVDKSVFSADQARQDKATSELNGKVDSYAAQGVTAYNELKGSISSGAAAQQERDAGQDEHINAVQGAAQAANEKGDALAVRADNIEKQAGILDGRVGQTEVRLDGAEGAIRETNAQVAVTDARSQNNAVRLDRVETVQGEHTSMLGNHETRITSAETHIASNTQEIKKTQTVVKQQGEQLVNHESRITNNETKIADHDVRITNNETNISNLSNDYYQFQDTYNYNNQVINQNMRSYSAQAVQQSKAYTDQQVGQLRNDWQQGRSDDQREYRSGIASVAAMANIPVVPGQAVTVGAGIGQFKDRTALAVGVGANIGTNVQVKGSVGFSNGSDAVAGAGIGFGF